MAFPMLASGTIPLILTSLKGSYSSILFLLFSLLVHLIMMSSSVAYFIIVPVFPGKPSE